jgi:L-ascorbate metabolism protein UlaG (beta-lactamase superfamily)
MKFTWLGGPSFVLELGPFRLAGDPVFAERFELAGFGTVTRSTPLPAPDPLAGLEVVTLVTSHRADHFDAVALERGSMGTILTPLATKLPHSRALAWGESVRLEKLGMTLSIVAVPAGSPGSPASEHDPG